MASLAKGIIDSVSNDFEMICCYANAIHPRCLYKSIHGYISLSSSFISFSYLDYQMLRYSQRILVLMNRDAPMINWKLVLWDIVTLALGHRK